MTDTLVEPVAWRWRWPLGCGEFGVWNETRDRAVAALYKREGAEVEPLYPASALTAAQEEIERLRRERQELSDYAFEATKAITNLTAGGSEYFAGKLPDGRYKADLVFCVQRIRERDRVTHDALLAENKKRRAAEAATTRLQREVDALKEALMPFAKAFEQSRYIYSRRYSDHDLGYANFDKMPDEWPMEKITFNMGQFRRARTLTKDSTNAG